jgi:hypothetical protein
LRAIEGNNTFTHHPIARPFEKEWVDKEIEPYHVERISNFSHSGCEVEFQVEQIDNDMFPFLGKYFLYKRLDKFDLKDVDPRSITIQDPCETVETPSGAVEPWNCQDTQGKIVVLQTRDAKPKIHRYARSSSGKSMNGLWAIRHHEKYNLEAMCKLAKANGESDNGAYCDQPEGDETPKT